MKKIVFSLFFLSLFAVAGAQEDRMPQHHKKMRHHRGIMMQKLNLSEAQKTQMKALHEDFKKQMDELRKSENTITVAEWKKRRQEIAARHKAKIQGLLTAEQKAQVEKIKAERKAAHEKHAAARLERMKTHLGLTESQVTRIRKNREELQQKIKTIRENKSLDEAAEREQMKELLKAHKENMKSILTDEQLKKMQEMKQRRGRHGKQKSA